MAGERGVMAHASYDSSGIVASVSLNDDFDDEDFGSGGGGGGGSRGDAVVVAGGNMQVVVAEPILQDSPDRSRRLSAKERREAFEVTNRYPHVFLDKVPLLCVFSTSSCLIPTLIFDLIYLYVPF